MNHYCFVSKQYRKSLFSYLQREHTKDKLASTVFDWTMSRQHRIFQWLTTCCKCTWKETSLLINICCWCLGNNRRRKHFTLKLNTQIKLESMQIPHIISCNVSRRRGEKQRERNPVSLACLTGWIIDNYRGKEKCNFCPLANYSYKFPQIVTSVSLGSQPHFIQQLSFLRQPDL